MLLPDAPLVLVTLVLLLLALLLRLVLMGMPLIFMDAPPVLANLRLALLVISPV